MPSLKQLKRVVVNGKIFREILEACRCKVEIVNDLFDYYYGYYEDRKKIKYNGKDEFICQEYIVYGFCDKIPLNYTEWKQVIVTTNNSMQEDCKEDVSGSRAKAQINKLLYKFYTKSEIEERLHMFEADYDENLKQIHYNYMLDVGDLIKLSNTYKFDINGAHLDALCEIFPKAKDEFIRMYARRKKYPVLKEYPNKYVGTLAQKTKEMRKKGIPGKFEKTYNWIVQRTSKKLLNAINYLNGQLVYANTDGVIIAAPKNILCTSTELGDFKLEYSGDTYIYKDKNYILYQTGDKMFGGCLREVRDQVDLRKGQVVHYDLILTELRNRKATNITKEIVTIYGD